MCRLLAALLPNRNAESQRPGSRPLPLAPREAERPGSERNAAFTTITAQFELMVIPHTTEVLEKQQTGGTLHGCRKKKNHLLQE